jgi:hypothetical protein
MSQTESLWEHFIVNRLVLVPVYDHVGGEPVSVGHTRLHSFIRLVLLDSPAQSSKLIVCHQKPPHSVGLLHRIEPEKSGTRREVEEEE